MGMGSIRAKKTENLAVYGCKSLATGAHFPLSALNEAPRGLHRSQALRTEWLAMKQHSWRLTTCQ